MRPDISAPTLTLLESGDFDVHWKLEVANGSGTLVDLSDRIEAISGNLPSPDQPIGTLEVEFLREPNEDGSDSLAFLLGASTLNRLDDATTYSPQLQVGRDVVASAALTARGGARPGSGFYEVFRGKIRRTGSPEQFGNARIACVDQSGALQRTKTETERTYAAGTPIATAIQTVLNDNGFSSITINVPVATPAVLSSNLKVSAQKTVWEVIWSLAQSIGWVVWWRYQADGAADLTLFEPDRDKVTSDFTFALIRAVSELDIDEEAIGNVLIGQYYDSDEALQTTTPVTDATSISKYGGIRRSFWISEEVDSPIRSEADMTALLTQALSDLSEPDALVTVTVPCFLFGEVSVDLYTLPSNDILWDSAQVLAPFAISFSHRIGQDHESVVPLRGKPTAGAKVWKGRGGDSRIPSQEPETVYGFTDFIRTYTATDVTSTLTVGSKVSEVWVFEGTYAVAAVPADPYAAITADLSSATILTVGVDALTHVTPIPAYGSVTFVQFEARQSDLQFGPGSSNIISFEVQPNQVGTEAIVDTAIIESKLADAAVTRNKILDAAVNDLKLASAAVTAAKVAVGAIETDKIAALAVTAAKIGTGAVETAKLANLAVTEAILAASAVTTTKIADDAVSTPKLIAGSVTTGKIAAGAVTANEIAANTITAGQIAAGTITSTQIAANTITAGNIAASTITASQIAANTILAANIAAATISGDRIASFTIVADNLTSNSITADKISSNAVTSDKILAGSVTAAKIAAGTITANEIAAGTITVDRLNVTNVSALNGSYTGALSAATGTFAGSLSAATGTFSGNITASDCEVSGTFQFGSLSGKAMRIRADPTNYGSAGTAALYIEYKNLGGSWVTLYTFSASGDATASSGSWL